MSRVGVNYVQSGIFLFLKIFNFLPTPTRSRPRCSRIETTFIMATKRKGNMETDDCEESWLTFPVAGMNFRYEFNFSSNFHENPVKEIPFSLLPFIPSLLFDNQCSVNADACNVVSRGEINS